MLKRIAWIGIIVASLQGSGCVSMGKYELMEQKAQGLDRDLAESLRKYNELTAENEALKAEVSKLKKELAGAVADKEALTGDVRKLEGLLKAKADTLSRNVAELSARVSELENENSRLKGDIDALQKAKEEKVREVSRTYEDLLKKMAGEIAKGEVTISELRGKLTVNMVEAVLFDSGKAEVKPEGLAVLQKVVDIVKDLKDKSIRVEGHTDTVPIIGLLAKKYPTNWELSAARAVNVTRFLQQQGVNPQALSAAAYGEYKPVDSNDTEEGRARNRRIEIVLVPRE